MILSSATVEASLFLKDSGFFSPLSFGGFKALASVREGAKHLLITSRPFLPTGSLSELLSFILSHEHPVGRFMGAGQPASG